MNRKGFTLLEMMVVIGIIAILLASFMVVSSRVKDSAAKTKLNEQVHDVQVALVELHRKVGGWPEKILTEASGGHRMTKDVARIFAKNSLLGISHRKGNYDPEGIHRCGIVTPWAEDVLNRSKQAGDSTRVPAGGTVTDHMLYFAVDADDNGVVEQSEGAPVDVRAQAVVWSAGPDGVLGNADDVKSWQSGQEKKK